MTSAVRVVDACWDLDAEREALVAIREAVFIVEQRVSRALEMDGADPECRHLLARLPDGTPVGAARMKADGHIGRIAVLERWRGRGIGARLVEEMVVRARDAGLASVDLDSQTHAIPFYEKLGFASRGEVFMEAGIPHQNMVRRIEQP